MAERPDDDNSEDSGMASEDKNDPLLTPSGSNSQMSHARADVKNEGKKKKFRPLDAVRKLFKRRPKLKEIDSARARSTSALYGHTSGEGEEEEDEGGFLSRISLRKNKSRSEDSVLVEARTNQTGILRKLAYSVEGINKSIYSSNSGKSSSRNSLNSTESQQEHFKDGFKCRSSSVENSEPGVDLEAVAKTEALNTDAAKFKISVRPKGRKGTRQSRKNRQKVASNLPCLNEEQQVCTNPSLNDEEMQETTPNVENEKMDQKDFNMAEPVVKKKREPKISLQNLPPKPRPKSTPVAIHSTPQSQHKTNITLDLESAGSTKHLPNPELLEFGKIRSKSLDIEGKGQRFSDLGLSPVRKPHLLPKSFKSEAETTNQNIKESQNDLELEITSSPNIKKTDIQRLQLEPKLESQDIGLEEKNSKIYGSYEKNLHVGLDSPKSLVISHMEDKNVRLMKSPMSLELRSLQNVDGEDKASKILRSPVKGVDLGLRSPKSPIQTPPNLGIKSFNPQSPTRNTDLEIISLSTPGSEEEIKALKSTKGLDLGLKPLKSPEEEIKALKSTKGLDLGLKPLKSPEEEIKALKSTKGLDLRLKPLKSPEEEIKALKSSKGLDLGLKPLKSPEEEIKTLKSSKGLDLGLKPLKSPVQLSDVHSSIKSLQSPSKHMQDKELKSPKSPSKSKEFNDGITEQTLGSQECIQNAFKNFGLEHREIFPEPSKIESPSLSSPKKEVTNEDMTNQRLQSSIVKDEDNQPKSPKKIIASLELSNLATKPLRSFSDPKSPRGALRSPNLSPRSPILPPKPIRSPLGSPNLGNGFDKGSSSIETPKFGLKLESTSASSENLYSKSPQSPLVAPKLFSLTPKPLKSPSLKEGKSANDISTLVSRPLREQSEFANSEELSPSFVNRIPEKVKELRTPKSPPHSPIFCELIQKPLKRVPPEETTLEQKLSQSPLHSPKAEEPDENPFFKSINVELKSPRHSDSDSKELPLKPNTSESKPLKVPPNLEDSNQNQNALKKPLEKPSLGPKPLKSPVEVPSAGPKLNAPSSKTNRSNKQPTETSIEVVDERKSQVGKHLEIFEAIGKKDSKIPATPKITSGSTKPNFNVTDASIATSLNVVEKSNVSVSARSVNVPTNKQVDIPSCPSTPQLVKPLKTEDPSNISDKPKLISDKPKSATTIPITTTTTTTTGLKFSESSKIVTGSSSVPEKPKISSTPKVSNSSKMTETTVKKIPENSSVVATKPEEPESKLASTANLPDSSKISDSSKRVVTPKKLDSSKHSKETPSASDETNVVVVVATSSKTVTECPPKVATDPGKSLLTPKMKPFEVSSSAANEIAGSGIDVTQNNTNRLSALFEAKSVAASQVDPGTTLKIEVITKDESTAQKSVKLREKGKSTEKISELSSRQSKVLDLVKNFQKLQAT